MELIPIKRYTVKGKSMQPTLKPGQDVLVWCWFVRLKIGDLVVFKKSGREMIKRVRQIYSDRKYFVQGDNERMSTDSRNFGPISKKEIIGKVIWY